MYHVQLEDEYVHNLGANIEVADILWSQKWAKKLVYVGTIKQFRIPQDWLFQRIPVFFAVFQADFLNENQILAIIIGKIAKDHTKFDRKLSFLRYFK